MRATHFGVSAPQPWFHLSVHVEDLDITLFMISMDIPCYCSLFFWNQLYNLFGEGKGAIRSTNWKAQTGKHLFETWHPVEIISLAV